MQKELFRAYIAISLIHGIFNHSNVRFRFRFLRWVIATQLYHHWHHSNDSEARNKNFAAIFPLMDWIFGTLHLPKDRNPQTYGISEEMPKGFWKQLKYPFGKLGIRKANPDFIY